MRRLLSLVIVAAVAATSCSYQAKDFDQLFAGFTEESLETAQTSRVWDRNGRLITELRGEQNRTDVAIAQIPELVQHAVVAIEDDMPAERVQSLIGTAIYATQQRTGAMRNLRKLLGPEAANASSDPWRDGRHVGNFLTLPFSMCEQVSKKPGSP